MNAGHESDNERKVARLMHAVDELNRQVHEHKLFNVGSQEVRGIAGLLEHLHQLDVRKYMYVMLQAGEKGDNIYSQRLRAVNARLADKIKSIGNDLAKSIHEKLHGLSEEQTQSEIAILSNLVVGLKRMDEHEFNVMQGEPTDSKLKEYGKSRFLELIEKLNDGKLKKSLKEKIKHVEWFQKEKMARFIAAAVRELAAENYYCIDHAVHAKDDMVNVLDDAIKCSALNGFKDELLAITKDKNGVVNAAYVQRGRYDKLVHDYRGLCIKNKELNIQIHQINMRIKKGNEDVTVLRAQKQKLWREIHENCVTKLEIINEIEKTLSASANLRSRLWGVLKRAAGIINRSNANDRSVA